MALTVTTSFAASATTGSSCHELAQVLQVSRAKRSKMLYLRQMQQKWAQVPARGARTSTCTEEVVMITMMMVMVVVLVFITIKCCVNPLLKLPNYHVKREVALMQTIFSGKEMSKYNKQQKTSSGSQINFLLYNSPCLGYYT